MIYCKKVRLRDNLTNKIGYEQMLHQQAYKLLEEGIYSEYGISIDQDVYGKNQYGKPFLNAYPKLHFSISHCEGMASCAISESTIGIDIEPIREIHPSLLNKVCSCEELNTIHSDSNPAETFFRFWTLKESYIKAIGRGLSYPMRQVNFKLRNGQGIESNQQEFDFEQYVIDHCFILSICRYKLGGWA